MIKRLALKSLSVKGYRSFGKDTKITFSKRNVIIGANNSGKSSLMELMYFAKCFVGKSVNFQKFINSKHGISEIISIGKESCSIEFTFEKSDFGNLKYGLEIAKSGSWFTIVREFLSNGEVDYLDFRGGIGTVYVKPGVIFKKDIDLQQKDVSALTAFRIPGELPAQESVLDFFETWVRIPPGGKW